MDRVRSLKKPVPASKVIHEVEKDSNLDLILRGTNGAVNKLADAILKGLSAVALALSTPNDNSAEVAALTARIKTSREQIETAVQANEPDN